MSAQKVTSNVNLVAFVLRLIMFVMVKWIVWMGQTNGNAQKAQVKFIHCFNFIFVTGQMSCAFCTFSYIFSNLFYILFGICTVLNLKLSIHQMNKTTFQISQSKCNQLVINFFQKTNPNASVFQTRRRKS